MGEAITVHKLDATGREVWTYHGEVLQRTADSVTLQARFDREAVEFHGLRLERDDVFVETFYRNRWYNIFAIHDQTGGALKGWYCNITRPARITPSDVYAEDLALDLVVLPDGKAFVLDEDEFEALALDSEERKIALRALEKLQAAAHRLAPPFSTPERR